MQAIEAALDLGLIIMENGGATLSADRAFTTAVQGLGGTTASSFWRTDVVIAAATLDGHTSLYVRYPAPPRANLVRVSEAAALADRIGRGQVDETAAAAELTRIKAMPPPYPRVVTVFAAGITAGSFARLIDGDWGSVAICAVAAAVGQGVRSTLLRGVRVGVVTIACAALSAFIAAWGLRAHVSTVEPATLVASVVYMIPGLALVNGFIDMTSPKYFAAGAQRIGFALLAAGMLAAGIAIGGAVAGSATPWTSPAH
jgi:uncharacterized membrane protein YjjP (DUF1212 family)